MSPLLMIVLGFALLALFCFGGHVAGSGKREHIASAARAFILPWVMVALGNLWIRWWDRQPLMAELLWLVPVVVVPIIGAFAVWRHYRTP